MKPGNPGPSRKVPIPEGLLSLEIRGGWIKSLPVGRFLNVCYLGEDQSASAEDLSSTYLHAQKGYLE